MAIEILENTLLKLLVRRGTDFDRKQIMLASGELGYATDTERLYIGNSVDIGGVLVGNKWKGRTADLTTLAGVITGDIAFDTNSQNLNVLIAGDGSNATDWYTIADHLSAGNGTINITADNKITVGTLSGGNFHANALGDSIELDGSNRIALSGSININKVSIRNTSETSYLTLPRRLKIGDIGYSFPAGATPGDGTFLGGNSEGVLNWSIPEPVFTAVAPTSASVIPVGSIVPFASGAIEIPYGWLECDGSEYLDTAYPDLYAVIKTNYNTGGETSASYFRVPNLVDKVVYGAPVNPPINSTLMGVSTGVPATLGSALSATAMTYIIKSIGGVTNPTLTIRKNLSAFVSGIDKTDVAFNPLSGEIVIERPAPGMQTFSTAGETTWTIPSGITYMKYYVTGSGANGGNNTGGAAATVIGNVSAAAGTIFTVTVAAGPTGGEGGDGAASSITVPAGTVAISYGGCYCDVPSPTADFSGCHGCGLVQTSTPEVLNGFVFVGGAGGIDTSGFQYSASRNKEAEGASSYWGSAPAPGAGTGAHKSVTMGQASEGFVMFEWN